MNKAIIENYKKAEQDYKNHMEHVRALQKKGADIDAGLPALKQAADEAGQEKNRLLDLFCIDQASDDQTEAAQKAFDTASARLKHSQELLKTVNKKIGVAESSTMGLIEKVRKYQKEVWDLMIPEIEDRLIKKVGNDLVFLFSANMRQRMAWGYEPLLTKLFPKPSREQIDSFAGTLDAKFNKAIG
jgi:hypothetical protein